MTWMIEGEIESQYQSGRVLAHRHYTDSYEEARAVAVLYSIRLADGSNLYLSVCLAYPPLREKLDGFSGVIRDCIRFNVRSVEAVWEKRNNERLKAMQELPTNAQD